MVQAYIILENWLIFIYFNFIDKSYDHTWEA